MMKIYRTLALLSLSIPAMALAQQADGVEGKYDSMQECREAIKNARHDEKNDEREAGSPVGQRDKYQFQCVRDPDGGFAIVQR